MKSLLKKYLDVASFHLGMKRLGPSHAIFISYTKDQSIRASALRKDQSFEGSVLFLDYQFTQQSGGSYVAQEIERWTQAEIAVGIYGPDPGYFDPRLGRHVVHWEYELLKKKDGYFRPFIESGAPAATEGDHAAFLNDIVGTIQSRHAEYFNNDREFLAKARRYIIGSLCELLAKKGSYIKLWKTVIFCLVASLLMAVLLNTGLRSAL